MTTDQTPSRYQVIDYKSVVDGKIEQRFAHIRDGIADHTITVTSEIDARDLIAKLSAWLDAPRLAARATAEVVAQDGKYGCGYELLRSSAGEWGVLWRDGDGSLPSVHWHTDERQAREEYATERDMALCICGAECDEDEIDRSGGESMCPKCVTEAHKAFGALHFDCRRCGADLLGADLATRADSDPNSPWQCPRCNHFSVEEIDAMTEAAP